jgi:uncharacterized membrane protein (DUF106 family)
MSSPLPTYAFFSATPGFFRASLPLLLVVLVSAVIGLLMVVVFRYTSDQKAIHVAKDQLKAHLLAVRLFQDQIPVVLASYGRILSGTGRYLKLAFKPLLYVILPLVLLIAQVDRYLGYVPLAAGEAFLLKVHTANPDSLNEVTLQLPPELTTTAPAVHVPSDNEIAWRLMAAKDGDYDIEVIADGQGFSKRTVVSSGVPRVSPVRLRGRFWERVLVSGEPALPDSSPIQSIEVSYPARSIHFAWLDWNWIWLFFVLSLVAGFFFKSVLGIEI